ncbi:histidine phosphatase family protein [Paracoccus tibetensis]|uniref:Alpha-ribazole phosphatase n=1 Tax=Paracoccus tibetensis TaxID=336292 RepID=A0A1G5F9Q7_9RHOB|nr:histidine phosphatase family protein [Paracoccus tibetensis]SCY35979.1 alpha-ribazole phosphatase [Paracoccus tibetensis]
MRVMILRHAMPLTGGRLAGRTEVDADCSDRTALAAMAARVVGAEVIASPARRCIQTADAMGLSPVRVDPALWEQDYGAWEGQSYADLPDLGPLPLEALAAHRPPGGESFRDMAARVRPVLEGLERDTLLIAHAGTVRAGLAMVVGDAALSFSVAPLSLTILRRAGPEWAVEAVNLTWP